MRKKLSVLIFAIVILLQACFSVAFATLKEEDGTQSVVTITYNLDVTGMPEGSYYIRGVAEDAAGNQSDTSETAPFVEYYIDHTAPAVPANFSVESTAGYLTLKWDRNPEIDLAGYNIYRAEEEAGPYTVLAEKHTYLSYLDREVQQGITYYYKVAAIDTAGNIGMQTAPFSAMPTEDVEAVAFKNII